ncbi:hypothetical protein B9Z55_026764 [Caenorhabditis nigoni]|uniref:ZZ-type domain-containing protein n=1 Tax=Caenorhabditis nigoni TaxID=1611254 RepID=A0A2G5SHN9_9PELO|nr:hypothetical protein B9Z55_026764 [Caenorhabditis nigoni]
MDLSEELEFLPPEERQGFKDIVLEEAKNQTERVAYYECASVGSRSFSGRPVRQLVYVTFYIRSNKKIVSMFLDGTDAKKQIEEKAAELMPTASNQADFEFKDSRQIMNAIKRSPICKFYYLLVRLEPLHPIRTDSHEARCDECRQMIYGHRYKCTDCADFDICQNCESKSLHSEHAMLRIKKDGVTHIPNYITANAPRFVFPNAC